MKQYLATAGMCLREKTYFGLADTLGQYVMKAAGLAAMLWIWRVLLLQGADAQGMTLRQLSAYTILSAALEPLLNVRTPASNWLHDGALLGLYQRPSPLFGQLVAHTAGGWLLPLLAFSLPVLLLAAALGAYLAPESGWFFLSLPLAVSQGFAVDFLFACLLIRMRNLEWPVHSMREALSVLLTGALIPFAALPWGLGDWLALSPLGTLAGAPLSLFTGLGDAARLIPAQIVWNLTLWPLAMHCFRRSKERMVSYGG